jgi:multidrug efflux pump subunit AcrB
MIVFFYAILPRELAPLEDRGRFNISITGAEGSSYEYTKNATDQILDIIEKNVPEKDALISVVPGNGNGNNTANIRTLLIPSNDRKRSQMEIATSLTRALSRNTNVRAVVSQEPTVGDRRSGLPVQLVVSAPTVDVLKKNIPQLLGETAKSSVFSSTDIDMKFSKPQMSISIDREKARDLGLSVLDIAQSLQLALSGSRYGYYVQNGKQYSIIGQLNQLDRNKPLDLTSFSVRNKDGAFIPLDNVITLSEDGNPPQLFHYNRFVSATVSAGLAPGKTISEGITEIEKIAHKILPENCVTYLSGPARDFKESTSNMLLTFLFALVLVYLVLAAQFESFRHPFIIMFTVPLALAGALFSLWYFNQSLNIFSQIGIIMLIGLVTKNGILIVEFANQRRAKGLNLRDALVEASVSRFRPIVMTSLTVVLGTLPIALSLGASTQSRVSLGIVVIGGLLFSLVLSLFVVPIIYTYLSEKTAKKID